MKNKLYITTPIYYVNAAPHIGHSYTTIAADTLARSARNLLGKDSVHFLTGTDEHGQKIQKAALEAKLSPQEFVDKVVVDFKGLWERLGISYDDFIRTSESRHIAIVEKALEILYKNGDIYQDKYEGWYCTPCETFWADSQITAQACPDCARPVEKISESNYFFRMSKYQHWLSEHIETHPDFIKPHSRREEVLRFLQLNTLTDLCISRPKERLSWGIPLPFSKDHVAYVWFDALLNYISAVGKFDAKDRYVSEWWDDDSYVVHLMAKDILRHHAVYWPIILKSLNIRMPDTIFAHGWWMFSGEKMSKSRGNVVNPLEMVDKFGIDAYRYFLLRDVPFGLDGNFSESAITKRFNADLANDLGNLVYRTLTMIEKYFNGRIPDQKAKAGIEQEAIEKKIISLTRTVPEALGPAALDFNKALEEIWELINMANKYVENTKPWNLAKENKPEELESFIATLVRVIRVVSSLLGPFMPVTAASIQGQFAEHSINKGNPLFPRIDTKKK